MVQVENVDFDLIRNLTVSERVYIVGGRGSCRAVRFRSALARQEPRPPEIGHYYDLSKYVTAPRKNVPFGTMVSWRQSRDNRHANSLLPH